MINWNFLETFVTISENLSFSETAKRLNTAQPVISRQIKTLESNLGFPLFIRTKKKVMLTQEGLDLKIKLNPHFKEINTLLQSYHQPKEIMDGSLRIGSVYEAGESILLPKLQDVINKYPNLKIHLQLLSTFKILELISAGELDFGFVQSFKKLKSIRSFSFVDDVAVLIGPAELEKVWKNQEKYKIIGYSENDLYAKKFIALHFKKIDRNKFIFTSSVNSHASIIQLVISQKVMAIIPKASAQKYIESGVLSVFMEEKKKEKLNLICYEQTLISKKNRKFLEEILSDK